jgi:hypothetical protein
MKNGSRYQGPSFVVAGAQAERGARGGVEDLRSASN